MTRATWSTMPVPAPLAARSERQGWAERAVAGVTAAAMADAVGTNGEAPGGY
jgi:hypothetical protein